MRYFLLKNHKNRRVLGAPPPDPLASSGWGLCPRPPLTSGGWERANPATACPSCDKFLATRLSIGEQILA